MTRRDLPSSRFLSDDTASMESLVQRMIDISDRIGEGSIEDYSRRSSAIIERNVQKLSSLTDNFDAFDILELVRMFETPMMLDNFRESTSHHLPGVVTLCALILAARGARRSTIAESEPPSTVISQIHEIGQEILIAATFAGLSAGRVNRYGPLTSLAAQYTAQEINVKYKQYVDIYDDITGKLFSSSTAGTILQEAAGFSYEDLIAVRDAITKVHSAKFDIAREALAEIAETWAEAGHNDQPDDVIERGRHAFDNMLVHPGDRATVTVEEIAETASLSPAIVSSVMSRFAYPFQAADAVVLAKNFVDGWDPFRELGLMVDADEQYIMIHGPIGMDHFRQMAEEAIKGTANSLWHRYDRHRTRVSEGLTVEALESLLGTKCQHVQLKYFKPRNGIDADQLGRHAVGITSLGDETEADALFIVEDVAICVEVKGRSVSTPAREGHVKKLANDLRKTIGEATSQALRLESLIETNEGLWLGDQSWLDLSGIHEIRSIAVCLDDIGPLGTALDELVRAGVVGSTRFPWIVSLHDLIVVSRIVERPAEFLLYLRRRTESGISLRFHAVDELDLFMLFMKGGLNVSPDPAEVYAKHPEAGPPRSADLKQFRKDSVLTRVGTHTDDLDAWMYYRSGQSVSTSTKPRYTAGSEVVRIVDFLAQDKKPGWFRFSSDLLNLASDAELRLRLDIKRILAKTMSDAAYHTMLHCYAGSWGFPTLFIATCPPTMRFQDASDQLYTYLLAKKHQLRSDRALAIVLSTEGEIVSVRYDNSLPTDDPELDGLGRTLGLVAPAQMQRDPRSMNSPVRHPTKKQRAKTKAKARNAMQRISK